MNVNKLRQAIGALTLISLVIPASAAASTGWYLGFSSGESRAKIDERNITADLLAAGFNTTAFSENDKEFAFKLVSGYRFNQNFSLEGGYFDLGKFDYTATTSPAGSLRGEFGYRGLNLDLIAATPLSDRWELFGRFGVHHTRTSVAFASTGAADQLYENSRSNSTDMKAGLGIAFKVSDVMDLRLEAERYRMDNIVGNRRDINMVSFGLVYYLGRPATVAAAPDTTQQTVTQTPQPAPPAPAPQAQPQSAPEPAPEPEAEPLISVSFAADSLFDFDSSEIRPTDQRELDQLLSDLEDVDFSTIMVTGHTDRIGAEAYNRQLSNERATAVRDYLVRAGNIDPSRVSVRGLSSTQPVTTLAQCGNQLARPQLIACLAPDRRVEVEVEGTRQR